MNPALRRTFRSYSTTIRSRADVLHQGLSIGCEKCSMRLCRLQSVIVALGFCVATLLLAADGQRAAASVQARISQIVQAADLHGTKVSIAIVDADTGQALATVEPDVLMMPASNLKIVTTAAALDTLGSDFSFRTTLSVQPGDDANDPVTLIVRGDGDPAFADPKILVEHEMEFEQLVALWVDAARKGGVKHVGRLVMDDRVFDREFVHETWPRDQLNRWYCAQVAGINFNDNCLDVYPQPTSVGRPPNVTVLPIAPFITSSNRATTSRSDSFWISRKLGTNQITYWGKVKYERTEPVHVTVHDPPMVFGRVLSDRLTRAGIKVDHVVRASDADDFAQAHTLHTVQTRLWEVVSRCNKDSQNLFA